MKAVLMSIQPKWCELIASGKKTVEVRKTKPKIDVPFKCYIYCTKGEHLWKTKSRVFLDGAYNRIIDNLPDYLLNGKVIGEFVCDKIECFTTDYRANVEQTKRISEQSCVSLFDLEDYECGSNCLFGWHITDLVIYDKPKELSEFHRPCEETENCLNKNFREAGHCLDKCFDCGNSITRPPQSWCYVEEREQ